MKLVVPLTIPSTRWTFVTTSASRSTLITGIAAQTEASKRSCTPASWAAAAKSSAPALRDELLVRGHDGLAGAEQVAARTRRPGSSPPITSATTRDLGVVEDLGEVGRQHARRGREVRSFAQVADERRDDAQPVAGRALDVVGLLLEQPVDGGADGAVAEQRDGNVDRRHAPTLPESSDELPCLFRDRRPPRPRRLLRRGRGAGGPVLPPQAARRRRRPPRPRRRRDRELRCPRASASTRR